jgi:RNA polymerase sigma-B factor
VEHQYEVSEDRACSSLASACWTSAKRKILPLRFFDGLTQSQIACSRGISQMHVSRLIRRSLEKIRQEIASDEIPEAGGKAASG